MRPIGVALIAIWQWLSAALHFGLGCLILFGSHLVGGYLTRLQSGGDLLGKLVAGFGTAIGGVVVLLGILHLAGGFGVWMMKGWGRSLVLILCVLSAIRRLPSLLHFHAFGLVSILVPVAAFVYLMIPDVGKRFS